MRHLAQAEPIRYRGSVTRHRRPPMAHPIGQGSAHRSMATGPSPAEASRAERFRPDLEGLRAVAVILVLLYHARVPGFGGGYVGVDVFFVLSGFLITGLIVRELRETGSLSLAGFYARRARRLLPAAALVLLVTLVAAAVFTPSFFAQDVAADGLAAALYASNIRFALQATDYLAADLDPSPILHYWSLGVEEQFYLFWPALLLLVARRTRSIGRALVATSAIVFIASLGLSIVLTDAAAPWAFFSLPARAWELALGALIALGATRLASLPPRLAAGAVMVGLALVAASALVIEPSTPFPGLAAIMPVGGAALVILGGLRQPAALPSRLLAVRPARYIGRISYSLYLWHWPFLILPTVAIGVTLSVPTRVGLVLLAIVAAAATQRWVEEPIRHGRWVGLRPARSLAAAGALTLVVATVASAFGGASSRAGDVWLDGDMERAGAVDVETEFEAALGPPATHTAGASPPPETGQQVVYPPIESGPLPLNLLPPLDLARDSRGRIFDDGCFVHSSATVSPECAYGDPASETTAILFGDSHAAHWFPPLEAIANDHGWRLVVLTKANCPAADIEVHWETLKRRYHECGTWRDWALERIAAEDAELVIVSNSRAVQMTVDGGPAPSLERPADWEAALGRTLGRIEDMGAAIALIGDTPRPAGHPVRCLWRHRDDISACGTPIGKAIAARRLASERSVANALGATFIDPTPWICPTDPCPAVIGRLLIYRDAAHLTAVFAAALTGRLERELVPILSRAAAPPG
jgi:peptidoglycan/LPS O-acetylase OafA/YrhL